MKLRYCAAPTVRAMACPRLSSLTLNVFPFAVTRMVVAWPSWCSARG